MLPFILPFILQGVVMAVDEFYFHHKRGLPLWEKVGHPLDTISVAIAYAYLYSGGTDLLTYLGLAGFSCVFITKDEFVHADLCGAIEQWLHGLLFVVHPVCFLSAWHLALAHGPEGMRYILFPLLVFLGYQVFRWSPLWIRRAK